MNDDRAILTYHSLDDSGSPISLRPAAFERHLDWMVASDTRIEALEDLDREPEGATLALTFDDGFANFATEAWPRLKERSLPVTLFVVAGLVGGDNRWGGRETPGIPTLPLLGWDQLGRMAEEGLRLGCHSMTHPDMRGLSPRALEEETAGAAALIEERTGVRPTSFCYPFGHVDDGARAAAGQVFDRAVTTRFALLGAADDRLARPRIDAWYFARPGLLENFGSSRFRNFVARRRVLRSLRGLLSGSRLL